MLNISLSAEQIFHIGSFPVTNALLMSWLTFVVLLVGAITFRRKLAMVPKKMQGILELLFEEMLGLMDSVLGDRKKSERYLPLVATIFFFILCSNWLGLLPGVGSIIVHTADGSVPFLRSAASDLNF